MQLKTTIKNGDLILVSSGIVIINALLTTSIILEDDGDPLEIRIKFVYSAESNTAPTMSVNNVETWTEITFMNVKLPFPTFSPVPWRIGDAYNRELYFMFAVTSHKDSDNENECQVKVLRYSFYLGKEVTNG